MFELEDASFRYASAGEAVAVRGVDLHIPDGQAVLVCGESGCGKTTLLRLLNGLVPHYYEGELAGAVRIGERDTRELELYDIAPLVGSVFQNPKSQFFTVDAASEVAFGCENLGVAVPEIEARVRRAARELRMGDLLGRSLFALSGGEKQKVACASVSAMAPSAFVLDEPTSNLDMAAIGDLRDVLLAWKAQGKTVVVSEHRLAWLMGVVDRVVCLREGRIVCDLPDDEFRRKGAGEVAALGLRPLSVDMRLGAVEEAPRLAPAVAPAPALVLTGFSFSYPYQERRALDIVHLELPAGQIVGIVGPNGAGKSTFARCLCGLERHAEGELELDGELLGASGRLRTAYLVMQDVNHQLFAESVFEEVLLSVPTSRRRGQDGERRARAEAILESLNLADEGDLHPLSLSGGERQRVAIAGALASLRRTIVFDEPTSGLDFRHMAEVAAQLERLREAGTSVFVITHDPELICRACTYLVCLEGGRVSWASPMCDEALARTQRLFEREQNR